MVHDVWTRGALIGREIIGVNGERAASADFGDTGALVESRDTGQTAMIPMQEITATIQLWGRLRRSPHLAEGASQGLDESRAAFLVPLIVAIRTVPGMAEWLQGVQQIMAEMH